MIRITSGIFRGRNLKTLPGDQTRPTLTRIRQAWMNSLQTKLQDARVLDLFAGSGALGFEALSWGASSVVFVEKDRKAAALIRENAKLLEVEVQTSILEIPVERCFDEIYRRGPFDLIFVDPPYHEQHEVKMLKEWDWRKILTPDGRLGIESSASRKNDVQEMRIENQYPQLEIVRDQNYGETRLCLFSLNQKS